MRRIMAMVTVLALVAMIFVAVPMNASADSEVNIAPDATPSSSGGGVGRGIPGYGPSKMNDLDEATMHWISTPSGGSATAYWQLTWSKKYNIAKFEVVQHGTWSNPGLRNLAGCDIQYWDGSNWVTDGTLSSLNDDFEYTFSVPRFTDRIRITDVVVTGSPQASNPCIYEWYVYESPGTLYAGGSNPGVVYMYNGGTSWDVISPELGYAVLDLVEYEGHLYAATMSTSSPTSGIGRVYRYDGGMTWTLVGDNMDDQVCSLAVYQGDLYAGTAWGDMNLYRYDGGTSWTQVVNYTPWTGTRALYVSHGYLLMGDSGYDRFGRWDGSNFYADLHGGGSCIYDYQDYDNYVYGSAWIGKLWGSSDAITWSVVLGSYDGTMWELEEFQSELYMSYHNGELRASNVPDRGTIVYTAPDGIISMTTDGDNLYFGTGGEAGAYYYSEGTGIASVYKYDGTTVSLISGVDEMETGVQVLYEVHNLAPFADADGPYVDDEGSEITFDASGSSDAEGDALVYRWNINGEWTSWSASPTASHTWDDDYSGTVTVEVSDGAYTDSDTTTVTVNNVAPSVSIDSVEQPFSEFILPGDVLDFTGSFTDPGTGDTHTITWNFGDLTTVTGTLTPTHAYTTTGTFNVFLTVADDDLDAHTVTTTVIVISAEDASEDIDDFIQDLPDDAFKDPADQRQNALHEKLIENEDGDAVIQLIEAGFYEDALDKLQNDIRPKCDGDPH
jgi:hypothetical protein